MEAQVAIRQTCADAVNVRSAPRGAFRTMEPGYSSNSDGSVVAIRAGIPKMLNRVCYLFTDKLLQCRLLEIVLTRERLG